MPERNVERQQKDPMDLWPEEIQPTQVTPPVAILKRQASLLGTRTKAALRGKVETTILGGRLHHSFYIVAPALENYRYELFEVTHLGEMPYPVTIWAGPKPEHGDELKSEQEFTEWLRDVLTSEETRRVVGALLAQVRS